MRLRELLLSLIALLYTTAHSADNNFRVITQRELPNQLGIFREIEFTTPDNQFISIYAAKLTQKYRAHLHLHESRIQFLADYLDTLSRKNDFSIGMNGGFYQPDFTPVGLFVYQGKIIKPLIHNSLLKICVIIDKNNKIQLETDLNKCIKANNAMQTGPLLIENGKINEKLQAIQNLSQSMKDFFGPHKRTLLALTNQDELLMITTSPLNLLDFVNFLKNYPAAFGVTEIKTAVNLDGGSSTGMYIRFPDQPFYFHELKHVKTFIFID